MPTTQQDAWRGFSHDDPFTDVPAYISPFTSGKVQSGEFQCRQLPMINEAESAALPPTVHLEIFGYTPAKFQTIWRGKI
ncbi:hypothetical protein E6O75_ATG01313 [Venturia nashicola]|uniref:Uncharacterized protein n=1 Tax=Venturia nashicola TaxID=86259 RepID=A0A4Z1PDF5_9PEZI|nr:hypothetical protein E6O75_ATG01313 [Venturia nashicola]